MQLPAIFTDGLVLEQNARIWGSAVPSMRIAVTFRGRSYETFADNDGYFLVCFPAGEFGGPFELKINKHVIKDVYVGYVWLCSGQSNMELPISRVRRKFADELTDNPNIRAYLAPKKYVYTDVPFEQGGEWIAATSDRLDEFYATAYFFGRKIHEQTNAPIGLICCAAGGSTAEGWLSADALTRFPNYLPELEKWRDMKKVSETEIKESKLIAKWFKALDKTDRGIAEGWHSLDFNDKTWDNRTLTAPFDADLCITGAIWFRTTIKINNPSDTPAVLDLGAITDSNFVYVNGRLVGSVPYRYPPSIYEIPPGTLKKGKNVIAVRVLVHDKCGGFTHDKAILKLGETTISLNHTWKYKIGVVTEPCPCETAFYLKPCGFFYGMLAPVSGYPITGVIWYQGESNTGRPENYAELMETLIAEWRDIWHSQFPFIITQLANYEDPASKAMHQKNAWARLRDKQTELLRIPKTALAVTIDCGEHDDLHPLDKKTVGERLALCARSIAYGENIVYMGPIAKSAVRKDNTITVSFDHTGGGLTAMDTVLCEIESTGGVFTVKPKIHKTKLSITCPPCEPLYVRYAYANNPDATLYNKEGLPASPFRLSVEL